jgi:hypothetical protein
MAFPKSSFLIEIKFSQAQCGRSCYRINLNRRIVLLYYIRVLFNRWYRLILCTVKNLEKKGKKQKKHQIFVAYCLKPEWVLQGRTDGLGNNWGRWCRGERIFGVGAEYAGVREWSWDGTVVLGRGEQEVVWRYVWAWSLLVMLWTHCKRAQRNSDREFIPMCRRLNRPRSDGVHNNKSLGLTQPKRLAWWVRTAPTFMLCSPHNQFPMRD